MSGLGEIISPSKEMKDKLHDALKTRRLQLGKLSTYTAEQAIHMDITLLSTLEDILLMIDNHVEYLQDIKNEIIKLEK